MGSPGVRASIPVAVPPLPSRAARLSLAANTLAMPAGDLRSLGRLASEAGIALPDILRTIGLSPSMLDEQAGLISLADYFRVLERLSIAAHDEAWGLSRRPLLLGATDIVLSNLGGCRTLHAAMKAVARTYNILHGGVYNRVELGAKRLSYIIDDRDFPYAPHMDRDQVRFTMECVLIFLHGLLTLVAGDALEEHLRTVHTKSGPSPRTGACPAFWPAPVRQRARHYALDYDIAAQFLPVGLGDANPSSHSVYGKIVELIERRQRSRPRRRDLAERMLDAFDDGVFEQAAVARRLGLSVATLRRRLRMEGGCGFRELHDRALKGGASALLEHGVHPGVVAEELGYSDLRSFTRAFKRWTGVTPTTYARRAASAQALGLAKRDD
jgi:AraC-like DNA-binding protein